MLNRTTQYQVEPVTREDYLQMISVWEASVRATHFFLTEEDILFYRALILEQYFDLVALKSVRNENKEVVGFIGTSEHKIEMLFIHPDQRGKGIGRTLINYALEELKIYEVDVNEQNAQAVGFYEAMGFHVQKRSPIDGMGKPYPILSMTFSG
jgi:putative acetyltransferase